jgi:hypothetical protein
VIAIGIVHHFCIVTVDSTSKLYTMASKSTTFSASEDSDMVAAAASDDSDFGCDGNYIKDDGDTTKEFSRALEIDSDSEKYTEPLRPGDVIVYSHPLYVAGSVHALRETRVIGTDPTQPIILTLSNGEFLPAEHYVKRIKEMKNGSLVPHAGVSRRIENFRVRQRSLLPDGNPDAYANYRPDQLRDFMSATQTELSMFRQETNKNSILGHDLRNVAKGPDSERKVDKVNKKRVTPNAAKKKSNRRLTCPSS